MLYKLRWLKFFFESNSDLLVRVKATNLAYFLCIAVAEESFIEEAEKKIDEYINNEVPSATVVSSSFTKAVKDAKDIKAQWTMRTVVASVSERGSCLNLTTTY